MCMTDIRIDTRKPTRPPHEVFCYAHTHRYENAIHPWFPDLILFMTGEEGGGGGKNLPISFSLVTSVNL